MFDTNFLWKIKYQPKIQLSKIEKILVHKKNLPATGSFRNTIFPDISISAKITLGFLLDSKLSFAADMFLLLII